jgi:hypothetical protein
MTDMIVQRLPSSDLNERSLRPRIPLYHPDFPFIILWSQKAACTPVTKWFFLQLGLLTDEMLQGIRVHRFEKSYKSRSGYLEDLCAELVAGTKPVIKFVRDPYARAYSSYLGICSEASTKPEFWGYARKQIIFDLTGSSRLMEYTFSFFQYLHWLEKQDRYSLNSHIAPQFLPRDEFMTIRPVKIEALAENLKGLEHEFHLRYSVSDNPAILESDHFRTKSSALNDAAALSLLELGVPIRKSPDFPFVKFDSQLGKGTKYEQLVLNCFRQDVVLYGY